MRTECDHEVCVVTGGRVRIGYAIVLKLLRAGAYVYVTSRFPGDTAARYAREPDFGDWRRRLEVCLRRRMNNELNFRPNFERLVLGCIDADFCK